MLFDKISKLCKSRKISIAKLEKECGLGNGTIRGWTTSSPTIENLSKVAGYFGVSIEYLLDDTKEDVQ